MSHKTKLELTRIGKNNELHIEPRILIENPNLNYGDPDSENMLIHGDNLLALKALEQDYAGKIKCIYIDPPYNTGSAFEHYDDNVEHSIWLNLMKPRLECLKRLLAPAGVIVVQIWFDEMAYLKILMDEVFDRGNCIWQVAVRMSHSAGMKRLAADKRFIKNTEYILLYYNQIAPTLKPLYEISNEYPVNYYQYIVEYPKNKKPGKYTALIDIIYDKFQKDFLKYDLKKSNESIKFLFANSEQIREFIFKNKERIVRKDSNVPGVNWIEIPTGSDEFVEYITDEGSYYIGTNSSWNYYQIYSLEEKVKEVDYIDEEWNVLSKESITNLIGDWWDSFYKDMSRVDVEWWVKMKTSKKPERLVNRVFRALTEPWDYVLDSFLWSWTTAATAHKMNRKRIGIEMWEHCYSLAHNRMKLVVDWKDPTWISKIVDWKWWGWYKFYELWPSLLIKDDHGNYIINPALDWNKLVQALCKIENFHYMFSEDGIKHGRSSEKDFLHVTTRHVNQAIIDEIREKYIGEDEWLLILAKTFDDWLALPINIQIKKIPKSVMRKCEYNKDDYNLPVTEKDMLDEEDDSE